MEITKAEHTINFLFYSGEKKPHMWWGEFEKELSRAFAIYQRTEGRVVHSNEMKLRILMGKVQADFLQNVKAALNVDLSRIPMTLTYEDALATFRNAVNQKYPPSVGSSNNRVRRINEVGSNYGRGNGRNHGGGRGRGGRTQYRSYYQGGRGNSRGRGGRFNERGGRGRGHFTDGKKTKPDSWWTVCENGRVVECHPKISYPNNIWFEIPQSDRKKISELREKSRNSTSMTGISEATTMINGQQYSLVPIFNNHPQQIQQVGTQLALAPPPTNNAPSNPPTQQLTIMGGRKEQAALRSRGNHHQSS